SELDDGAVRTTHVSARASLGAEAGNDLDDQIDLIGEKRIQLGKGLCVERNRVEPPADLRGLRELPPVLLEELLQLGGSSGLLLQDAYGGHLADIRRREVDLDLEAIPQPRELDELPVEVVDDLGETLLGGRDQPNLPFPLRGMVVPFDAERLDEALEIEHLAGAACDVLPDLVDHEHECTPPAAPGDQDSCSLSDEFRRDVHFGRSLGPRIGVRVRCRIHFVQDAARTVPCRRRQVLHIVPRLPREDATERLLELLKAPRSLQLDLELRDLPV